MEISEKKCQKLFDKFIITYHKSYDSDAQKQEAFENFCKNYDYVQENKHKFQYSISLNENSDQKQNRNYGYLPQNLHSHRVTDETDGIQKQQAVLSAKDPYTAAEYVSAGGASISNYNRANYSDINTTCSQYANKYDELDADDVRSLLVFDDATLPARTDLRKLGVLPKSEDQGSCGSCYAHATRNVMYTQFYRDVSYYMKQTALVDRWNITPANKFSIQYILNNTFGNNIFCSGGTFEDVAGDWENSRIPTLEFAATFPYRSMMTADNLTYSEAPPRINTSIPAAEQINTPYYFSFSTKTKMLGCPRSQIYVDAVKTSGVLSMSDENVKLLKSVLARGVAVGAQMHTEGDNNSTVTTGFNYYSGGILNGQCDLGNSSNHQVTLIGYGTYHNTPVWVFQNSWGTSWGIQGSFMVKIGSNALCTENHFIVQMNRYFGYDSDQDVPFEQSQAYADGKDYNNKDINEYKIKYGYNGLDNTEEPYYYETKISTTLLIVVIFLIIAALIVLYFLFVWICCPPQNIIKPTVYIKFDAKSAQKFNWQKAGNYERNGQGVLAEKKKD